MTCLNSQLPVSFAYRIFACYLHVDLSGAEFTGELSGSVNLIVLIEMVIYF